MINDVNYISSQITVFIALWILLGFARFFAWFKLSLQERGKKDNLLMWSQQMRTFFNMLLSVSVYISCTCCK
jgi:hypothetical protein